MVFEAFDATKVEGYATQFVSHKSLKSIASGKLTLDERVVVHLVGCARLTNTDDNRERLMQSKCVAPPFVFLRHILTGERERIISGFVYMMGSNLTPTRS